MNTEPKRLSEERLAAIRDNAKRIGILTESVELLGHIAALEQELETRALEAELLLTNEVRCHQETRNQLLMLSSVREQLQSQLETAINRYESEGMKAGRLEEENARLKQELDGIKARLVVSHIEAICETCLHLKGEDGCPNCLKKELDELKAIVGR